MLRSLRFGIVFVLGLIGLASTVSAQCEQKACRGAYNIPSEIGHNECYDVAIGFSIFDGAPCVWNGSTCIGDPCVVGWAILVTLDPQGDCETEDCVRRLRAVHTNCGTIGALEQFTPSPTTPSYFKSGSETLLCGCAYSIEVALMNPADPNDPCVGGWKKTSGVTCTECKGP